MPGRRGEGSARWGAAVHLTHALSGSRHSAWVLWGAGLQASTKGLLPCMPLRTC